MRGSKLLLVRLPLALVAGVALLLAVGGCRSIGRGQVERELLDEPRGAVFADRIEQVAFEVDLGRGRQEVEARYVRLAPETESASGAPLVLLHGTPGSLVGWGPVLFEAGGLRAAAPGREIVLLEQLGHGFAPATVEPCTFDACSDYAAGALRALGVRDAVVLGHSYGGEVALRLALDHPDLVRALVLVDSSGIEREPEEFLPEEVKMRELSLATWGWLLNGPGRIRGALEPHFQQAPPAGLVHEMTTVCSRRAAWRAMVELCRDENGLREAALPQLAQPTLLLWGADDVAYPPERFAQAFADALPDARLSLVEGAGHYPFEERPREAVAALIEFLTELEETE